MIDDTQQLLAEIKARNHRVEADKAWETSTFRISIIAGLIYCIALAVLWYSGAQHVWVSALLPALGYILSTQSLPVLKRWWMAKR